jgi:hypothetical protein
MIVAAVQDVPSIGSLAGSDHEVEAQSGTDGAADVSELDAEASEAEKDATESAPVDTDGPGASDGTDVAVPSPPDIKKTVAAPAGEDDGLATGPP